MNKRAVQYLLKHGTMMSVSGRLELVLPLQRMQGFLDVLTPDDVPPEKLQLLYHMQARFVDALQEDIQRLSDGLPPEAVR